MTGRLKAWGDVVATASPLFTSGGTMVSARVVLIFATYAACAAVLIVPFVRPMTQEQYTVFVIAVVSALGSIFLAVYLGRFLRRLISKLPKSRLRLFFKWASAYRRLHRAQVAKLAQAVEEQQKAEKEKAEANKPKIETEAAVEDLRLARSYLDDWLKDEKVVLGAKKHLLTFAAQYVGLARKKDPNAQVVIEDKKEVTSYTVDDLAGETLFYESQYHSGEHATPESLRQAKDILQQALTYQPGNVQYREHLADVFLNLHDRNSALQVAYQALRDAPYDLRARKLLDRIEAAPGTRPPPAMSGMAGGGLLAATGALAMGGGVIWFFVGLFSGGADAAVAVFILGVACFFIGKHLETRYIFQKALENQLRKRGPQ